MLVELVSLESLRCAGHGRSYGPKAWAPLSG